MLTLQSQILDMLKDAPGLSDREIADVLPGHGSPQQAVNQACRSLEMQNKIKRLKKADGRLGNYLAATDTTLLPLTTLTFESPQRVSMDVRKLSEDTLKQHLEKWLSDQGWVAKIAWGATRGIDIDAFKDGSRWIIEVKGQGSLNAMRVNYFLAILGETLQRMSDPAARYSIALPDIQQFRNLWIRLPALAKSRTYITALFVDSQGNVNEVV